MSFVLLLLFGVMPGIEYRQVHVHTIQYNDHFVGPAQAKPNQRIYFWDWYWVKREDSFGNEHYRREVHILDSAERGNLSKPMEIVEGWVITVEDNGVMYRITADNFIETVTMKHSPSYIDSKHVPFMSRRGLK